MDIAIDIEESTRLVKIPVSVNNQGPFTFVFDTGASTTTLSKNLAKRLRIPTYENDRPSARGLGGGVPTEFAKASIKIEDLIFDEDEVYVLDFDKMLRCGNRDGVLGHSTLKHCILSIDYPRKTIWITSDGLNQMTSKIEWSQFEYIKDSHLIGVPVIINGQGPFDFVLDTGAGSTVITPNLAGKIGVDAISVPGIARGVGGEMELRIASLEFLKVNSIRLESPQVAVIDLMKVSPKGNLIENGIIGFDFFRNLETIIDYPGKQISFIDNRNS